MPFKHSSAASRKAYKLADQTNVYVLKSHEALQQVRKISKKYGYKRVFFPTTISPKSKRAAKLLSANAKKFIKALDTAAKSIYKGIALAEKYDVDRSFVTPLQKKKLFKTRI